MQMVYWIIRYLPFLNCDWLLIRGLLQCTSRMRSQSLIRNDKNPMMLSDHTNFT